MQGDIAGSFYLCDGRNLAPGSFKHGVDLLKLMKQQYYILYDWKGSGWNNARAFSLSEKALNLIID